MIIEFFGPPGAGKTTLAHALARRLNVHGHNSEVLLSYQPGEASAKLGPGGSLSAALRVASAIVRTTEIACHPRENAATYSMAAQLFSLFPPKNVVWFLRFGAYFLRLASVWRGCRPDRIQIFDQGFTQIICSLATYGDVADHNLFARALEVVPVADLTVLVNASETLLKGRLRARLENESPMERLFEYDLTKSLSTMSAVNQMETHLLENGRPMIRFDEHDLHSLDLACQRLEIEVERRLASDAKRTAKVGPRAEANRLPAF